ncbi:MAG TPA: ribosome-associated translation inhibitor RaiA [Bacteroidetes bacterium]|nr:ribosome-associated translation inhibitor RaiA [Bacteroidota bacterium]
MNTQIHSVKFDADKKLIKFINQKVNKLSQFSNDIIAVEVFLRVIKDQEKENKLVEIRIEYPRGPLFAKKQSKTFEEATDNVIEALKKQITKQKDKMRGK